MSITHKIKSALGMKESLPTVTQVNYIHLLGNWYEISSIHPISGESLVNSSITIQEFLDTSAGSDSEGFPSKLRIVHIGNKGGLNGHRVAFEGKLKVKDDDFAKMKIKFKEGLKTDFYIMDKDVHYNWLLVGDKARKNAWILSKTPVIDKLLFDTLLRELEKNRFDIHRLNLVQHVGTPLLNTATLPVGTTKVITTETTTLPVGTTTLTTTANTLPVGSTTVATNTSTLPVQTSKIITGVSTFPATTTTLPVTTTFLPVATTTLPAGTTTVTTGGSALPLGTTTVTTTGATKTMTETTELTRPIGTTTVTE